MVDASEGEALAFLARSSVRSAVLRRLAADGPCPRSALTGAVDASARTVKRTVEDLTAREWADTTESGYALTALGEHVLETYESAVGSLSAADRLAPFLSHLRAGACDVPVDALADAEVVEATANAPNAPLERALSFRRAAGSLRELSSIVTKESAAQLHQRVLDGDVADIEVVLERDVVETVRDDPAYAGSFTDVVESDVVSMFVHEGPFPFLLALADERAALGATDEKGHPAALVVTDDPAAVAWVEDLYESYRAEATPLPA